MIVKLHNDNINSLFATDKIIFLKNVFARSESLCNGNYIESVVIA